MKQTEHETYFRVVKHDRVEFVPSGIIIMDGDKFDKVTGRKKALEEALKVADLDRNTRTIIWENYHTIINVHNKRKS